MKNILLFICCLMTHITVYCMELDKKDDLCNNNIDYEVIDKNLIDDCKNELEKCLKVYKKSDDFTPQTMDNMFGVISYMTNRSDNSVDYIHCTKDKKSNGFFQYALQKTDLPIMQWLITKGNIKYHSEKEYADFIDFCFQQLLPTVDKSKRDIAYAILKSVIEHYKADAGFLKKSKECYLPIMIMLQLKHRALKSEFVIEEDLLIPFLEHNQTQALNGLSNMYQTIIDEEDDKKNTLAHIVVEQHDADELYILMKKNYISKKVKNSDEKTVKKLAFEKFRVFTQDTSLISLRKEESEQTKCCYFMLNKYFAGDKFDKRDNCCAKHPVLKRYESEHLKQSLSSSVSSSMSSSVSDSLDKKPKPDVLEALPSNIIINNGSIELPDEPEKGNCCTWLENYFMKKTKL